MFTFLLVIQKLLPTLNKAEFFCLNLANIRLAVGIDMHGFSS